MAMMLAPVPNSTHTTSQGIVYVADQYGVIHDVGTQQDVTDLVAQGIAVLTPPPSDQIFVLKGANFNSTSDQQLTPTFSGKFRIKRVVVTNASISLTTAAGGFYPAAAKGGTAIVASSQVYTALTGSSLALECTLNNASAVLAPATPVYLSLTTPQGAAATADIYVYGDVYI